MTGNVIRLPAKSLPPRTDSPIGKRVVLYADIRLPIRTLFSGRRSNVRRGWRYGARRMPRLVIRILRLSDAIFGNLINIRTNIYPPIVIVPKENEYVKDNHATCRLQQLRLLFVQLFQLIWALHDRSRSQRNFNFPKNPLSPYYQITPSFQIQPLRLPRR